MTCNKRYTVECIEIKFFKFSEKIEFLCIILLSFTPFSVILNDHIFLILQDYDMQETLFGTKHNYKILQNKREYCFFPS